MGNRNPHLGDISGDLPHDHIDGWTKQDLIDAAGISSKVFDLIRKGARIKGPAHGGLSWVFSVDDLRALINTADNGRFVQRSGTASPSWRALLAEHGIIVAPDRHPPKIYRRR